MKKYLLGLALIPLLVGCSSNNTDTEIDESIDVDMSENNPSDDLSDVKENDGDVLDWISDAILEKGADFLKSGISTLAVYGFKTACLEMGIDVRDATTKKLDQILQQLDQIQAQISEGFTALTNKAQQVQDENCMKEVLDKLSEVRTPVLIEMAVLEDLARKEDTDYDKDKLQKEKETFINNFKTKLNFYGLSNELWHSTEMLANYLISPNKVKTSQSLMDLYDNTLGANDVWDYQSYKPRMNFIKECSFIINSLALLSKLEAAKEISQYEDGDSNIVGVKDAIKVMCDKVNIINGIFQTELAKLNKIKENHDNPTCPTMSHLKRTFDSSGYVHITTDYTVSAFIATIGLNNVLWKNTVDDFYDNGTSHCFRSFVANSEFYNVLFDDYKTYITSYKVSDDYNLKYYLRDLGFRVPSNKQDDFNEAIGFYKNIDVYSDWRGIFRGTDHYAYYRYYDWSGSLKSNNYCRVGETLWGNYDDEEFYNDNINKKMITFMNADNLYLNGDLTWTIAHRNSSDTSPLLEHFYRGDSYNYGTTARYSIYW